MPRSFLKSGAVFFTGSILNAPTNNPLPGSQAGVYPGSPVTPPAGTAPFGAPPTAEAPNQAPYNGSYPGFQAPQ